ncbi:MAG: YitT family protein [Oscillospiraceae bacterium]|nr:YitT family protein [Oscillospiraceae bacterium]
MLKRIRKLIYIIFAIGLIAASVNLFLGPHSIAAGGITGLAIIFEKLFSFDRSITVLVANTIILTSALIFLGKEAFLNSILGAAILPVYIQFIPKIKLVEDPMLSMLAGSVIMAIAASILYANNASSGGTSLPPLIFKKYFKLNTSIGLLISDGAIVVLSLIVFNTDAFFYAIFSITITAAVMGYIESGVRRRKMVYIISDKNEAITSDILTKLERGVTLVPVMGAYKREEKEMIMVTMDSKNYRDLLGIVKSHDDNAFMITETVSQVHGQGFTYNSGSV